MTAKSKIKHRIQEDSIEAKSYLDQIDALKRTPSDVAKTFWEQFFKPAGKDVARQVFGKKHEQISHRPAPDFIDLKEGEDHFILGEEKVKGEGNSGETLVTVEHKDYFREIQSTEMNPFLRIERANQQKIDKIMDELQALAKTSKIIEREVKSVIMEIPPQKAGIYHATFFEWLLLNIRKAKERLDEGVAWTRMFASKKAQKQYWNMTKKHNTTFMLSGERTVATQTA